MSEIIKQNDQFFGKGPIKDIWEKLTESRKEFAEYMIEINSDMIECIKYYNKQKEIDELKEELTIIILSIYGLYGYNS